MQKIQDRLALRAKGRKPSPIRELLKYMAIDDMISLGGGYPNPATFMFENVEITFKGGAKTSFSGAELNQAIQYGPSDVFPPLKEKILGWHQWKDGVTLDESQIVILNGSQEGLFIMSYLFLEADDSLVVSEPTYAGALSAFNAFCKNFVSIPIDAKGMQTDILATILAEKAAKNEKMPKFIYTIPNGHNPGGLALAPERRQQLLDLARKYDILILEDDPYELVKLNDSERLPTIQSMDSDGRVIRLDSFSKIFAPGLRLGYATGAAEIIRQFVLFKQCSNMHTSNFIQNLLLKFFEEFSYAEFGARIRENCRLYRGNREVMVSAARKYLPESVEFNIPGEGMFIWFKLPEHCDAQRMMAQFATGLKVLLVPGGAFSTTQGLQNYMRASFSMVSPDRIEEGVRRFGEMLRYEMESKR